MCEFLDRELDEVTKNPNYIINKSGIKAQMLRIANMVNNKMDMLQNNNCITQEQRDAFVGKFNLVFNQAIQECGIGPLTQEDLLWLQNRGREQNITNEQEPIRVETQLREEIENIRPNMQNADNPSIKDNGITFKQKIARMLQNNQTLMKIPFIKNFAEKQLNALPPATQELGQERHTSSARTAFINLISRNGELRNLPPIQRMSDPERIEAMRRKMEEQSINDDNLR